MRGLRGNEFLPHWVSEVRFRIDQIVHEGLLIVAQLTRSSALQTETQLRREGQRVIHAVTPSIWLRSTRSLASRVMLLDLPRFAMHLRSLAEPTRLPEIKVLLIARRTVDHMFPLLLLLDILVSSGPRR